MEAIPRLPRRADEKTEGQRSNLIGEQSPLIARLGGVDVVDMLAWPSESVFELSKWSRVAAKATRKSHVVRPSALVRRRPRERGAQALVMRACPNGSDRFGLSRRRTGCFRKCYEPGVFCFRIGQCFNRCLARCALLRCRPNSSQHDHCRAPTCLAHWRLQTALVLLAGGARDSCAGRTLVRTLLSAWRRAGASSIRGQCNNHIG